MIRLTLLLLVSLLFPSIVQAQPTRKPNVIFILADDLGYAELGCYGQKKIKTPHLDKLAANGMRFTHFYAGSPVCAPSRCTLMTGKHPGHAVVRNNFDVGNDVQHPLPDDAVTIARILQALGYATAGIGKWGLGAPGTSGDPAKHGFDHFFGYYGQRHAHTHYPKFLWRNGKKIELESNDDITGKQYAHDLFEQEAIDFIKKNKERPFFLYLPVTIPHVALQVPEDSLAEYKGQWDDPPYIGKKGYLPHPQPRAAFAAMVTRMDRTVGRILDLLRELGLEDDTVIFFSSDNGATHDGVGGSDSIFFASTGLFRGFKGSLFEGGVRVPLIAYWRGRIRPGSTSDFASANWDIFPTLCELTGAKTPGGLDGVSLLPTLLGKGAQPKRDFLYWEFHGYGGQQAVRLGDWKGYRMNMHKGNKTLELYNLADDLSETKNLADRHPEIVRRIEEIMAQSHTPSATYPFKVLGEKK